MDLTQAEVLVKIATLLNQYKIPYMLTGAWNVIYFGRPRASHDIDFIVEIHPKNITQVERVLENLSEEFQYQKEAMRNAVKHKSMFNVVYLPVFIKLDFWLLKDDDFDTSRFSRRKTIQFLKHKVTLATVEDTILQKLRWHKQAQIEKHLIDAAFVFQIQNKNLDTNYLINWAKKLDVLEELKKLSRIDLNQYI